MLATLNWPQDRFVFAGPVSDAELAAYYRTSRVYVSMSEHEGFCVPLVEAMAADLPVLAYACTAVPDTLGGAGIQFFPKDFERVAMLLGLLASDTGLRTSIIEGQRHRCLHFQSNRVDGDLRRLVGRFQ
jgi:glycosyltransferase involved in cell wall biosynthesis